MRDQLGRGRIPSQYNGSLRWPMSGRVSQEFGCTGFSWEPPLGSCNHFHRGIDIVAPSGTAVHAAGDGVVVFVGYNPWDPPGDRAWIVIIAHSGDLVTWYAHMQARKPSGIFQGARVDAGDVVGWEGNTGNSTGRPPPLGRPVQGRLDEPAPVPLIDPAAVVVTRAARAR